MAEDEGSWGLERWPKKRRLPPPPDWGDLAGKLKGDLIAPGLAEPEAALTCEFREAFDRMLSDFSPRMGGDR